VKKIGGKLNAVGQPRKTKPPEQSKKTMNWSTKRPGQPTAYLPLIVLYHIMS